MIRFVKAALIILMIICMPTLSLGECMNVSRAQKILKTLNYYPDSVSGVMNQETVKSLRTFQTDHDLNSTGRLDAATCKALQAEEDIITAKEEQKKNEKILMDAQDRLKTLKYYEGPVDGKKSDTFKDALIQFQTANQLSPTGWLDVPTSKILFSPNPVPKKAAVPLTPAPVPPPASSQDIKKEPTIAEPVKTEPVKTDGPKPEPGKKTPEVKKETPVEPTPKKDAATSKTEMPHFIVSAGAMTYQPQSGYNSNTYEAKHETLHPNQDVTFHSESFLMTSLAIAWKDYLASVSTSRLGGGENNADSIALTWFFTMKEKPWMLDMSYDQAESDVEYGNKTDTVTTRTFACDLLYREKPGFAWGASASYGTYPTLVSCKNDGSQYRDIRFDRDFHLATINAAVKYSSLAGKKTPIPGTERLYPFVNAEFHLGLSMGEVSKSVINALRADLKHSFSDTIVGINLKFAPQAGLKYIFKRKTGDMEFTLGYGLQIDWPTWSIWTLPGMSTENHVDFYRQNISHGLILGGNVGF